jgi:hypothetical protein
MKKTVLLDVDGVLVRDRVLLNHVKNSVVRYVKTKIPKEYSPTQVNNLLYKTYGHTAIGLEKEYGVDASDFNNKVYTPHILDHLYDFLEFSDEFSNDLKIVRKILSMGYDVELFSNAPLVWTEPVRHAIDSFRVNNAEYSKPNLESYLRFDKSVDYIFVDDKMCNLMPSLFFKNWTPVHFSEKCENTFIPTINSLSLLSLAFDV